MQRGLICDPYRNRLLSEGPKNDKIDAVKLCKLLRSGLLKEVYHSQHKAYDLRKLVSAYDDLVKQVSGLRNQRSAIDRSQGKTGKELISNGTTGFTVVHIDEGIEDYERKKGKNSRNTYMKRIKRRS